MNLVVVSSIPVRVVQIQTQWNPTITEPYFKKKQTAIYHLAWNAKLEESNPVDYLNVSVRILFKVYSGRYTPDEDWTEKNLETL